MGVGWEPPGPRGDGATGPRRDGDIEQLPPPALHTWPHPGKPRSVRLGWSRSECGGSRARFRVAAAACLGQGPPASQA